VHCLDDLTGGFEPGKSGFMPLMGFMASLFQFIVANATVLFQVDQAAAYLIQKRQLIFDYRHVDHELFQKFSVRDVWGHDKTP
jgi:hypothetical protein